MAQTLTLEDLYEEDTIVKPSGKTLTIEELYAGKTDEQVLDEGSLLEDAALYGGKIMGSIWDAVPQPLKDYYGGAGSLAMSILPYLTEWVDNPVRVAVDELKDAYDWRRVMGYDTPLTRDRDDPSAIRGTTSLTEYPRTAWDEKYIAKILLDSAVSGFRGIMDPNDPRGRVVRAQDWLPPEFVENHPLGSFAVGFGTEVGIAPSTYYFPLAPGIRFVSHVMGALGRSKGGRLLLENQLVSNVLQGFNVYTGSAADVKKLSRDLVNQIAGQDYYKMISAGHQTKEMKAIASKLGITVEELNLAILRELEGYLPAQQIINRQTTMFDPDNVTGMDAPPEPQRQVKELADAYKDAWAKFLQEEVDAGVPISDLMDNYDALNKMSGDVWGYVPKVLTGLGKREGEGKIKNFFQWFNPGRPKKTGFGIQREGKGTTELRNIRAIEEGKVKPGEEYLYTDPIKLDFYRELWHNRAVASSRLRNGVRQFGRVDNPGGWAPIEVPQRVMIDGKWVEKSVPIRDDAGNILYFKPHDAGAFMRQYDILTNRGDATRFFKAYDEVQNWWKVYSLATRLGYYTRNLGGNFFNAYALAGLSNPKRYGQAGALQFKAFRVRAKDGDWGKDAVNLGGGRMPSEEIWREFIMRGLYNKGQYGLHGDIAPNLDEMLELAKDRGPLSKRIKGLFVPSTNNELVQLAFRAFGGTPENNAKLALFIDQLSKSKAWKLGGQSRKDAFDNAAAEVRRTLFDYSDVSQFERNVMKRAFPFYKWSRQNIPAHFLGIMQHPERYQKLNLAIQNAQYGVDVPAPEDISEWMQGRAPMYLSQAASEDVYKVIPLLNWLTYADLVQIGHPKRFIEQMASPFLKLPMEYFYNWNPHKRADLKKYEGETADFLGVAMPVYLHRFLTNLVLLSEIDRSNPWEIFGAQIADPDSGEVDVRGEEWRKQTSYSPFFQMLHEKGITDNLLEGAERETRMDYPGKTIKESRAGRLLQYLTGLRFYQTGQDDNYRKREREFKEMVRDAKSMLSQAEDRGQSRRIQELEKLLDQLYDGYHANEDRIDRIREGGKRLYR